MNKRITKRALYLSFVSMFLCFTMLLGTTYAWFTDTVTSGVNQIVAGNLDVELYHTNKNVTDAKVDTATKLFELEQGQLWEPGAMVYEKFTIKNEGSLALKYLFSLEASDCKPANFADALKVAIVEDESFVYNRENVKKITSWKSLASFELTGELNNKAITAKSFGVVIYWMPSANDNDFNMNNDKTGEVSVNVSVNLFATQLEAETDSFGPDYDANAAFGTYIELEAGADLLAAMASAEAADKPLTIVLNGDVEWPTEGHHGANDITPATAITIIGNGNTITATGAGVTPLGDQTAPMTLKDVKIVDNSVSYSEGAWEFTYLEMGGTKLVCENVTFADEIQIGTNATFTNCSFESNEASVYAVWVEDGSASFTNCTFTGYRGLKVHEDYGTEVSSVIVKDCTFSDITKKPGIALGNIYMNGATYKSGNTTYTNTTDTTVSITGCTFINCQAGDQGKYIYETDTDVTTFNFVEENNTVLNNATAIATPDDLVAAFANLKAGDVIYIGADLDMTGKTITPVSGNKGFTMYGNGNTISNLNTTAAGLFVSHSGSSAYTFDGVVLENCSVDSTTNYGALFVGDGDTSDAITITNCVVKNCNVKSAKYAAAFVGYTSGYNVQTNGPVYSDVLVENCSVIGGSITGGGSTGAAIGHAGGNDDTTTTITNLTVDGVAINGEDKVHTGIVVGTANVGDTVINNAKYSNVTGNYNGLFGRFVPGTTGTLVIDGAYYVNTKEGFSSLMKGSASEVNIILADGKYENLLTASNKKINIVGENEDGAEIALTNAVGSSHDHLGLGGCTVNLKNVKVTFEDGAYYAAYINNPTMTYTNCTITGQFYIYGNTNFIGCTFDNDDDAAKTAMRYIYIYDGDVLVDDCDFYTQGHALIMYSDNGGSGDQTLTVRDSRFHGGVGRTAYAVANQNTAGIEIDGSCGANYTLILEGTNTFDEGFSGLWRIKGMKAGVTTTVNGIAYTGTASDVYLDGVHYTKDTTSRNVTKA